MKRIKQAAAAFSDASDVLSEDILEQIALDVALELQSRTPPRPAAPPVSLPELVVSSVPANLD